MNPTQTDLRRSSLHLRYALCQALLLVFLICFSAGSFAETENVKKAREAKDWASFDEAMEKVRAEEKTTGTSYLISGTLVTIGGLIGAHASNDAVNQLMYGLSEGIGVAAIGYGTARLTYGNEFDSFYNSIRNSSITIEQKNAIIRAYLDRERDRRQEFRRINCYSYLALGLLNVYSASTEKDPNAKTFMGFLAGINFALSLAYAF